MSVGYSARRPVPASAKHEHALGEGYHPGEVGRLGAERRRARHALPWASVSPLHRGGPAPCVVGGAFPCNRACVAAK
jgi:hypothetical protein